MNSKTKTLNFILYLNLGEILNQVCPRNVLELKLEASKILGWLLQQDFFSFSPLQEMKRCGLTERGRSIFIVLICCQSHTLFNSKIQICKCAYSKEQKNLNFSQVQQICRYIQIHIIICSSCHPPHHPPQKTFFLGLQVYFFIRKVLIHTLKAEMRQLPDKNLCYQA